tara:strand:+ start:87 stop:431 length:345 start_codon:yes stop_codon:yes gene_type:complete
MTTKNSAPRGEPVYVWRLDVISTKTPEFRPQIIHTNQKNIGCRSDALDAAKEWYEQQKINHPHDILHFVQTPERRNLYKHSTGTLFARMISLLENPKELLSTIAFKLTSRIFIK